MTNTLQNKIEEAKKRFDETFGKAGPERDSDSIGRRAGCDDCSTNIELREEHKSFLEQELSSIYTLAQEEARKEIEKIILENSHEVYSGGNGFLQTNTDKVMLAIKSLPNNTLQ